VDRGEEPFLSISTCGVQLVYSRYELLVEHFSAWLRVLLAALPLPQAAKRSLNEKLSAQYQGEFVPDGKHKHSLRAGSNLARLKPSTRVALGKMPRLRAVMQTLNYTVSLDALASANKGWGRSRHERSAGHAIHCRAHADRLPPSHIGDPAPRR
jgi:hypothetical protein